VREPPTAPPSPALAIPALPPHAAIHNNYSLDHLIAEMEVFAAKLGNDISKLSMRAQRSMKGHVDTLHDFVLKARSIKRKEADVSSDMTE